MHCDFSRPRLSWASVLGIVCIALVLMSGVVQSAHFHASGAPDHDCTLCMAAHHVARMAAPVILNVSSVAIGEVTAASTIVRPRDPIFFRLSSRPPPSGSALLA